MAAGLPRERWRLVTLGFLVVYAVLLATGTLHGRSGLTGAGVFDLRTGSRLRTVALAVGIALVLETLRFVPLGVLTALVAAGRTLRALAAALATATVALAVHLRAWPGPVDLALPWLGAALGVAAVWLWRAPSRSRRRTLWWTAGLAAATGALAVTAGLLALEPAPLGFEPSPVTSDDKRRVYRLLKGKNPRKVPEGETVTLALDARDLDLLFAWGLPLVLGPEAKGRVDLAPSEDATVRCSLPVRALGDGTTFLNVEAGARVRVENGTLDVAEPRLRVGRLAVPDALLRVLTPALRALVVGERRLRPLLASVRALRVDRDRVTATYARMDLPPGLLAETLWGEDSSPALRDAVRACALRLLAAPDAGDGDARFGAMLRGAFAWAAEGDDPVARNRAALLALGILRGHTKLERFTGPVLEPADWDRAPRLGVPTLRGRDDWVKHFLVSAALTVISAEKPSDAAGLLKEELDADGGSGFSFADLAADRSGTTFAAVATRDDASARAIQERLGRGFVVDDYFPPAADLPEGIPDAELKAKYGGVGGALYLRTAEEVERRVAGCAAFRDAVSAGASSAGR